MESLVSYKIDYTPMPITATFAGLHEFSKLKLFSNTGNRVTNMDEPRPMEAAGAKAKSKAIRYRECNRNHAISTGGYAVDGCGEFMPGGEEGTVAALKCAACDCHRNFHRKEVEGEATCDCQNIKRNDPRKRGLMAPGGPSQPGSSQQLALPTPAQIISRVTAAPFLLGPGPTDSDDGDGGLSGSPSTIKKRFRTRFNNEQKEKMGVFAEKLGWKIQKHDEAAVQEFCAEVGVKRHVLKVWMHNNKHTIGKKPP
ncbi:zinc-finger homeodomain protein 2 [Physcomitrium patens]|uniref:ZF-HD dimerization-type domain-containing protein n=1 Tax=Physcomitrium patens TaxID=3218 RepID=A0A2K1L2G7_PHYPA|nr:zinc-finger homeodomain protein 2-like [Physcomitrium patens]PNR60225.1 hypothetical protein PHYPA_003018 [Physcomitrium patens]|eukprot:XP_024368812.1 zinc-finger homeodomain protein 2-like [Physcomitrella patens]